MSIATSKRAEANRRNAARSTGPRTPEGKANSRFNALKHGLAARIDVLPDEDPLALLGRRESWIGDLKPRDQFELYLVERAVHVSWQLDRTDRAQAARAEDARFARSDALTALTDEITSHGARLLRDPDGGAFGLGTDPDAPPDLTLSLDPDDPDDPARLVNRIEDSALGCAWMLDRWSELRDVLEDGQRWQPADRLKAVRLLGKQPLQALDDRAVRAIYLACAAMDPDGPHPFADVIAGLPDWARPRFLERLEGRDALAGIPADAEAGRADLLATAAEEEQRLEELVAIHLEREETAAGWRAFDDSPLGETLRKYQVTFSRTLFRLLDMLRQRQKGPAGAPIPTGRRGAGFERGATAAAPRALDPRGPSPADESGRPAGPGSFEDLLRAISRLEEPDPSRGSGGPDLIREPESTGLVPGSHAVDPSTGGASENEANEASRPVEEAPAASEPPTFDPRAIGVLAEPAGTVVLPRERAETLHGRDSKNEAKLPSRAADRRGPGALAILDALLRVIVAARMLPGWASSVVMEPASLLIEAVRRLVPPSMAPRGWPGPASFRPAFIPVCDRPRSFLS